LSKCILVNAVVREIQSIEQENKQLSMLMQVKVIREICKKWWFLQKMWEIEDKQEFVYAINSS